MNKWTILGLITWCSFSSLANNQIPEIDRPISSKNPASMGYYVEHYQDPDSPEYRDLLIGVRVAADTINLYTTRLDAHNQRIDYCLPMKSQVNRETLRNWKTEELMELINNQIERNIKKYGKPGINGSIGYYLTMGLKEQYPCPVQKQF
ncbi:MULTISPECIES: hypothetical protein [Vibrio]|uniref:Rap1a immunity protein domain-containing protein n=2 Tax=Vibrio TaxID=662 RepID=A0ABV4KJB3_9VIBR|nr:MULTISPECIES: hypothetical protein [Vibrio]MDP2592691.1 hypothetical protein [Vibrio splendidus]OEF48537.1 hypothetical protein A163_06290 [Vibrio tasmaniensis 1F-267]PMJ42968.1 hypothetical protein BCU24_07350 [Vibrio cyclitrophicus]PMN16978.1 hypothetical protein BCT41_00305 [Vibrio splendidus]PMO84918.1 hypothetical protein BCT01_04860 [Vibrio tasmaniensis]